MKNKTIVISLLSAFLMVIMAGCSSQNLTGYVGNGGNDNAVDQELDMGAETVLASSGESVLGTYKTEFTAEPADRNHNIKLAAKNINETILKPGQTFSFNESVGPTGGANGFKKARIFVNGKESTGYGGGVCQVSSTVYNAALAANMEIVERHPHSKKVSYVPPDKDAATSYGDGLDFKFKNNKNHPVKIQTTSDDKSITVNIVKA